MANINDLKIDDTVIVHCKNGALIAGPWKGTGVFNNAPIVQVGRRAEFFESVLRIDLITGIECVYDERVVLENVDSQ